MKEPLVNAFKKLLAAGALLLILEVAAGIWYHFRTPAPLVVETNNLKAPEDFNAKYESVDLNQFVEDSKKVPKELAWHPYVYWRRPVYNVPSMHVDERGIRRTVQPHKPGAKAEIFAFGGSTMWGTGVHDAHTVPSLLAKDLAARGYKDFHITNFGESAYVSTQELLTLLLELRRSNVPKVVIFYDGINDVASAMLNRKAGATQHEGEIGFLTKAAAKVENTSLGEIIVKKSNLVKAIVNVGIKVGLRKRPEFRSPASDPEIPATPEEIADSTVSTYWGVVKLAQALGQQYGFEVYFFWQPSTLSKSPRSPQEEEMVRTSREEGNFWERYAAIDDRVNAKIRSSTPLKNFTNLSSALNGNSRNLFSDLFHLTENGNQIIAKRIADSLAQNSRVLNSVLTRR